MEVGIVRRVDIEEKMRGAYLSYAMSVITARALPDVRDGLKPVQRRILYAMDNMNLRHDQPTRKSARIIGEVLGKYHPHSDTAVYDAMVRMAQDFSMRYPLIQGQGNFGSVDGDAAAAIRYTEARLSLIGEELLYDLDKDTVDFIPNFDAFLTEPVVLPAKLPNLLLNGAGGIAVGMATNIPPHNLGELADAIVYLIDHYDETEDVSVDDLMQFVQGPDFPTGASILGREQIRQAYATGKGAIVMRAQAHIEDLRGGHQAIIITELPFQVNKASLVERIAELARDARVEGIADLRDESDRTGMRVVVELKRGAEAGPILAQLLKQTQLQGTFGVNMLALVNGEPKVLSLKRILLCYIEHRHEVVTRRSKYELEKARARLHILEGLLIALDNLDAVIDTIRRSRDADTALKNLCAKFKLDEIQARAILDLQLRRLAALERKKIEEEYAEVKRLIAYLLKLLASEAMILGVIKQDVLDLKKTYGDARRTRIVAEAAEAQDFNPHDLLPDEEAVVVLSYKGTVRRLSPAAIQAAEHTASGLAGVALEKGDAIQAIARAHSRESVLFFTDRGRALQSHVHQIPDVVQQPSGGSLRNLVSLASDEQVVAMLRLDDSRPESYLTFGTRQGKVKRLALSEISSLGTAGAQVIGLVEEDRLGWALQTSGSDDLLLVTIQGKVIRFQEDTVRPQGRSGTGVRGITLAEGDVVVGMDAACEKGELVVTTAYGFAKRTKLTEYGVQGRGGNGLLTVDVTKLDLTGLLTDARVVLAQEEVLLCLASGRAVRSPVTHIPELERASWGRVVSKSRRGAIVEVADQDSLVGIVRLGELAHDGRSEGTSKKKEHQEPAKGAPAKKPAAGEKQLALLVPQEAPKAGPVKPAPAQVKPARPKIAAQSAVKPAEPSKPATVKKEGPAPGAKEPARKPEGKARVETGTQEDAPKKPAPAARPTEEQKPAPKRAEKPTAQAPVAKEEPAPVERAQRTRRTAPTKPPQRGRAKPGG